jgi:hypothetical protein
MSQVLKNMYKLVLSDCIANGVGYSTTIEVANIPSMIDAVDELKIHRAVIYRIPARSTRADFVMEPPCSERTLSSRGQVQVRK